MVFPSVADADGVPRWVGGLAVLAFGISLTGLADYAVHSAGYPGLAAYVWALGYAGTIMVLYMAFLRDVEFSAAAGTTDAGPADADGTRDRPPGTRRDDP